MTIKLTMVKDIFNRKIISIEETSFKYRLLAVQNAISPDHFLHLLDKLEKSYTEEPYDYGYVVKEIEKTLKKWSHIKNKREFAKIIDIKRYETVCRIEKSNRFPPKGKRKNSLDTAYKKLIEYFHNNIE